MKSQGRVIWYLITTYFRYCSVIREDVVEMFTCNGSYNLFLKFTYLE